MDADDENWLTHELKFERDPTKKVRFLSCTQYAIREVLVPVRVFSDIDFCLACVHD